MRTKPRDGPGARPDLREWEFFRNRPARAGERPDETVTDESVERVLAPVIALIRAGAFDYVRH